MQFSSFSSSFASSISSSLFSRKAALALAALAALGLGVVAPAGAQTISTVPNWNGSTSVAAFGTTDTATYGEVVTAPSGHLNSFTFYFANYDGGSYQTNADVYAWNGTHAVGSALAASGPYTVANGAAFAPITFTANANLTAGQQYVLFVNTSASFGAGGNSELGFVTSDPYAGGQFVYDNNNGNFGALTSSTWDHYSNTATNQNNDFGNGADLAFTANFAPSAPVPEASTTVSLGLLLALGLGGLVIAAKRKKASSAL